MLRHLFLAAPLALTLSIASSNVTAAPNRGDAAEPAVEAGTPTAPTPERIAAAESAPRRAYGPILAEDPEVRAEIKSLYELHEQVHVDTKNRIVELNAEIRETVDHDVRRELVRELGEVKSELERRNVEIRLEIARLNEDVPRVARLELVLDQMTNPEKYRPEISSDAQAEQQRLRELSISE